MAVTRRVPRQQLRGDLSRVHRWPFPALRARGAPLLSRGKSNAPQNKNRTIWTFPCSCPFKTLKGKSFQTRILSLVKLTIKLEGDIFHDAKKLA